MAPTPTPPNDKAVATDAASAKPAPSDKVVNVPNALSAARFVIAIFVCWWIEQHWYLAALIGFVIAVSTDWIDGWWARKYNQVTKVGRILDPFVDKIIICGTMIGIAGQPESGLAPWIATVVVGRELLVTSLRGMIEGKGGDFSAKQLGKWKMVLQCAAVVACLLTLIYQKESPPWMLWGRFVSIWGAVLLTIVSGVEYMILAARSSKS
jgi:CDP-diacylglycerol--glycerol-3-phosphate 3-phosphatidyltransferase